MSDKTYCGTDLCDFEAVEMQPVSPEVDEVTSRSSCYICGEAYSSGAQHGAMRSIRCLVRDGFLDAANHLNGSPLTRKQIERIQALDPQSEYGGEDIPRRQA